MRSWAQYPSPQPLSSHLLFIFFQFFQFSLFSKFNFFHVSHNIYISYFSKHFLFFYFIFLEVSVPIPHPSYDDPRYTPSYNLALLSVLYECAIVHALPEYEYS